MWLVLAPGVGLLVEGHRDKEVEVKDGPVLVLQVGLVPAPGVAGGGRWWQVVAGGGRWWPDGGQMVVANHYILQRYNRSAEVPPLGCSPGCHMMVIWWLVGGLLMIGGWSVMVRWLSGGCRMMVEWLSGVVGWLSGGCWTMVEMLSGVVGWL